MKIVMASHVAGFTVVSCGSCGTTTRLPAVTCRRCGKPFEHVVAASTEGERHG